VDALQNTQSDLEVFIIGGAEIYRQAIGDADRIYLTLVHAEISGDTFFPELDARKWHEISRTRHEADEKNPYAYSFVTYDRKNRE
jgi:dihydrofolate reductase